jgi:cold-inducible RNA-binding protein
VSTKLYVGNLDYGVTGDQLGQHFAEAGTVVEATVITDRYSGRSKGFGFVEMSNEDEVKKAIEMFNGQDFQGRNIVVSEARPREPRKPQSGFSGSSRPRSQSGRLPEPPVMEPGAEEPAEPEESQSEIKEEPEPAE